MHVSEITRMLFIVGKRGNIGANEIDQFAGCYGVVAMLVRSAFERFDQRVGKRPVAAAILRPFRAEFFRTRRHQTQHFARRFAQFFHHAPDRGVPDVPDQRGAANIGQKHDAAHLRKLLFDQLLDFRHRQGGGREILRIAVISHDISAAAIHRSMPGEQDKDGIFFAGPRLQKSLESVPQRGRGGLFIGQDQHLIGRNAAATGAGEMLSERFGIRFRVLESQFLRQLLVFRDADQHGVSFGIGRNRSGLDGGLCG